MREESIVLGTIISDPQAIVEAEALCPEDFSTVNRVIWKAMRELAAHNALTANTLEDKLRKENLLAGIGGVQRIYDLQALADSKGIAYYVDEVINLATKAEMKRIAKLMVADENRSANDMIEDYTRMIAGLRRGNVGDIIPIGANVTQFDQDLKDARLGKLMQRAWYPATEAIGPIIGHVENDDFVIVPARPGQGKTSWLKYEAINHTLDMKTKTLTGRHVLFFNYENSRRAMERSIMAHISGIDSQKLKIPKTMSQLELQRYQGYLPLMAKIPIHVVDAGFHTVDDIIATSRRAVVNHPVSLIMVDYLQLIQGQGEKFETVSNAAQQLRSLAQDLNIPVVCTAQLNRVVDTYADKKPNMSDIMYDGERAAKLIIAPWTVQGLKDSDYAKFPENRLTPGRYLRGREAKAVPVRFLILKNSNGPAGKETPDIKWDKSTDTYVTLMDNWRDGRTWSGKQDKIL